MQNAIAITNQKGGVGKSTTAQALAVGLKLRGFNVLAVDMDPQGNLSYGMGAANGDEVLTVYDLMKGTATAAEVIQHTEQGDVIPSNVLLSGAELEFNRTGREHKLERALRDVAGNYDYIVIDTPPSLGVLTANAYTVADRLIIPMMSDIYSIQGIYQLRDVADGIREYCNQNLTIAGILITRYNGRSIVRRDLKGEIDQLAAELQTKVYKSTIREAVAVVESQATRQGIQQYAPSANVTKDYEAFIDEFLKEED